MTLDTLRNEATSSSSRLIAFEEAEVRYGFNPDIPLLFVSGHAPCFNMDVQLLPFIYVNCPEYWGIELVGRLPGDICLTAIKPFMLVLPLTGIIGSAGVELIAANGTRRFNVAGGCDADGPV